MKTIKCILFLFTILCCKSYAHIGNHSNLSKSSHIESRARLPDTDNAKEKKYINANQLHFDQTGIYVQMDQNWVSTNAVYTDANGFYILETKGGWTCGYCGKYNEGNIWTCENCGKRRE